MARIPTTDKLTDIQQSFRELWEMVRPLEAGPFDTHGRRVRGGDAIDPQEFITKRQLERALIGTFFDNKTLMESPELVAPPPVPVGEPGVPERLFTWNRADTTQFSTATTGNPTQNVVLSVVTTQANSSIRTSPYLSLQHNVSTPPGSAGDSFVYTANALTGNGVGHSVMLVIDLATTPTAELCGIIFAKSGSETTDFYLLTLGATTCKLDKYIGGTLVAQGAASSYTGIAAGNGASYKTFYWLVRSNGRSVIRVPGIQTDLMFDAPMDLTDSTVWGSGKFGIKARYDVPNSSFIGFSRFWVLSVPPEAEPLFL